MFIFRTEKYLKFCIIQAPHITFKEMIPKEAEWRTVKVIYLSSSRMEIQFLLFYSSGLTKTV